MAQTQHSQITGQVFNIQRFSTHDGPGIRTTVFLKGCPLRCAWCQNPESQSLEPVLLLNSDRCTVCGRCIKACPHGVNTIDCGKLVMEREKCTFCGACIPACLIEARTIEGKTMTVEEVMTEVAKDYLSYESSGGGLTISGGDCEMQPEFTVALLKAARSEGIHTAVEITGVYPWDKVKAITDEADFILYDLKHMDDARHIEGTRVSNKHILENARHLVEQGRPILFRIPLIPGYNDSRENVEATARFVADLFGSAVSDKLELLPYNNLGEDKYDRMDFDGPRPKHSRQDDDYIAELNALVAAI